MNKGRGEDEDRLHRAPQPGGRFPASFGIIPPIVADSAQAIREIIILANSSRLIRPE